MALKLLDGYRMAKTEEDYSEAYKKLMAMDESEIKNWFNNLSDQEKDYVMRIGIEMFKGQFLIEWLADLSSRNFQGL